jgi:hypothetical protein
MLQDRRTDLLLTISRHVLRIVIAILGLIIAAALGAMIALLFFPSRSMTAQLAAAPDITMPVIFASVAIGILMLVLSVRFMIELGRIVRTVQQGDPFDPENADRLARMGWLALALRRRGAQGETRRPSMIVRLSEISSPIGSRPAITSLVKRSTHRPSEMICARSSLGRPLPVAPQSVAKADHISGCGRARASASRPSIRRSSASIISPVISLISRNSAERGVSARLRAV